MTPAEMESVDLCIVHDTAPWLHIVSYSFHNDPTSWWNRSSRVYELITLYKYYW